MFHQILIKEAGPDCWLCKGPFVNSSQKIVSEANVILMKKGELDWKSSKLGGWRWFWKAK